MSFYYSSWSDDYESDYPSRRWSNDYYYESQQWSDDSYGSSHWYQSGTYSGDRRLAGESTPVADDNWRSEVLDILSDLQAKLAKWGEEWKVSREESRKSMERMRKFEEQLRKTHEETRKQNTLSFQEFKEKLEGMGKKKSKISDEEQVGEEVITTGDMVVDLVVTEDGDEKSREKEKLDEETQDEKVELPTKEGEGDKRRDEKKSGEKDALTIMNLGGRSESYAGGYGGRNLAGKYDGRRPKMRTSDDDVITGCGHGGDRLMGCGGPIYVGYGGGFKGGGNSDGGEVVSGASKWLHFIKDSDLYGTAMSGRLACTISFGYGGGFKSGGDYGGGFKGGGDLCGGFKGGGYGVNFQFGIRFQIEDVRKRKRRRERGERKLGFEYGGQLFSGFGYGCGFKGGGWYGGVKVTIGGDGLMICGVHEGKEFLECITSREGKGISIYVYGGGTTVGSILLGPISENWLSRDMVDKNDEELQIGGIKLPEEDMGLIEFKSKYEGIVVHLHVVGTTSCCQLMCLVKEKDAFFFTITTPASLGPTLLSFYFQPKIITHNKLGVQSLFLYFMPSQHTQTNHMPLLVTAQLIFHFSNQHHTNPSGTKLFENRPLDFLDGRPTPYSISQLKTSLLRLNIVSIQHITQVLGSGKRECKTKDGLHLKTGVCISAESSVGLFTTTIIRQLGRLSWVYGAVQGSRVWHVVGAAMNIEDLFYSTAATWTKFITFSLVMDANFSPRHLYHKPFDLNVKMVQLRKGSGHFCFRQRRSLECWKLIQIWLLGLVEEEADHYPP